MDLDQIEETYKQETEKAQNEFLEEYKIAKDKRQAETTYKQKAEKIRTKYYQSLTKEINRKPKSQKSNNKKKEQNKVFKPEGVSLKRTKYEEFKLKTKLRITRTKFAIKHFIQHAEKPWIKYLRYRIKREWKNIGRVVEEEKSKDRADIQKSSSNFAGKIKKVYLFLEGKVKKVALFTLNKTLVLFKKIKEKLKKKERPVPEKKEEPKPEESTENAS